MLTALRSDAQQTLPPQATRFETIRAEKREARRAVGMETCGPSGPT